MNARIPQPIDYGNSAQGTISREAWHLFGIMSEFADATFGHDAGRSFAPPPSERGSLLDL